MYTTTNRSIPVPSEYEDPWFAAFAAGMVKIDEDLDALFNVSSPWTEDGGDLYLASGSLGVGRSPLANFDVVGNALFQWGLDASDLSPRLSNTTLSISTQRTDLSGEFHGVEAIMKSKDGSAQVSYDYTAVTYNYADHTTGESGTMVGFYHYGESHGSGWNWGFATQIEDFTGDAWIIGEEILLIRNVASTYVSVGMTILAGGAYPLTYGIMIDQATSATTGAFGVGIAGFQDGLSYPYGRFLNLREGGQGGTGDSVFYVDRNGALYASSIWVEHWHEIGTSGEPAFEHDWVNANTVWGGSTYSTAAFCIDKAGFVHLKGTIISGAVGAGGAIFTLPYGYLPAKYSTFAAHCLDHEDNAPARVDVAASGEVIAWWGGETNNSVFFLDGITFRAPQT
jgi:hypothetical protein